MRSWEWSFERIQLWIQKNLNNPSYFTANESVLVWTFGKTNDWKKYQTDKKDTVVKPFMFRNIHTIRFCQKLSEKHILSAPFGIYLVPYYKPNWPILVIPRTYGKHPFVFGEHFSLPFKDNVVNVHLTTYVPSAEFTENPLSLGRVLRDFDDLPSPCLFPPSKELLQLNKRELLIDFLSLAKEIPLSHTSKKLDGGTLTEQETMTHHWNTSYVNMSAKALANWNKANLEYLCIIGIRTALGYDFMITQYDLWDSSRTTWTRPALVVSLPKADPKLLYKHITKWLEQGHGFFISNPVELEQLYN